MKVLIQFIKRLYLRSYQRTVSNGGVGSSQLSPFIPLLAGSSVPNTRHSVESYTKLYDQPSTNNHGYDQAKQGMHGPGYDQANQGFQPMNPGVQCQDPKSGGLVHGYENGSTGFVHNYDQGIQSAKIILVHPNC